MSKVTKLLSRPAQFFVDTTLFRRFIGHANPGDRSAAKPALTPAAKPKAKPPATGVPPDFKHFQAGTALNMPASGFNAPNPWAWHLAAPRLVDVPSKKGAPLLAVFPSGSPAWDAFALCLLGNAGYTAGLLRPFECAEAGLAIEDLVWHAERQPLAAHRLALHMVAEARAAGAVGLVVPHDAPALTRALVLLGRQAGLPSLCLLQPGPHAATGYGKPQQHRLLVADALAWLPELWTAPPPTLHLPPGLPVARIASPGAVLQEALTAQSPWDGQGELPLECLGIGPNDDPVLVLGHKGVPGAWDSHLEAAIEAAIAAAVEGAGPSTHLVLVLSARKRSHLNAAALSLLQRLPRKTILTHEDPLPWRALADRCARAVGVFAWEAALLRSLGFPEVLLPARAMPSPHDEEQAASSNEWRALVPGSDLAALLKRVMTPVGAADDLEAGLRMLDSLGAPEACFDCIAVPDPPGNNPITLGRQRHLLVLLGAARRVHAASAPAEAATAQLFVQWGADPNEAKSRAEVLRTALGRPKLYLEDGFVRSIGLWTDPGEPALSVVMDTRAVYYDATRPSLLETWLNSDRDISAAEHARARSLIQRLLHERISKYNYAPDVPLGLDQAKGRRVLLVDQKAGDMSLRYGLAPPATFERMLDEALALANEGGEVLIKQHPCAISGGEDQAHYTRESLSARGALHSDIQLICFEINPFALFDAVQEVWVATSGMGLEALFAGRRVRCFGAPFYAGWGLTEDAVPIPRRYRKRSLEDLFHAFYLRFSRYVDPRTGRRCELEDLLDALRAARAMAHR